MKRERAWWSRQLDSCFAGTSDVALNRNQFFEKSKNNNEREQFTELTGFSGVTLEVRFLSEQASLALSISGDKQHVYFKRLSASRLILMGSTDDLCEEIL